MIKFIRKITYTKFKSPNLNVDIDCRLIKFVVFKYTYARLLFCVLRRALFFFLTYKVISNTLMLTLNEILHTTQDDVHVIIFIILLSAMLT